MLGAIAYLFHFPPESLWDFTKEDFEFWMKQAEEVCHTLLQSQ